MTVKIGINGFGRIGRLAFRRILELSDKASDIEVVAINDLTSPDMLAYLLNGIIVNVSTMLFTQNVTLLNLKWVANDGVDYVLEATGFYTSAEKSTSYLDAGARRIMHNAIIGSIANVLEKEFGVKTGLMLTVHAYTASQSLQDGPKSANFAKRQANRDAASNSLPHSSAIRVPVPDGSITELTAVLKKDVTVEEVNAAMKKYESDSFGYNGDGLVSTDIINDTHGTVFDPTQTEVVAEKVNN
ncbi:hypothetical protein Pfo_028129 [Paulownia fortunei]|nr:hypothetical protein Pfo_028129 [Paulownia fortunei]